MASTVFWKLLFAAADEVAVAVVAVAAMLLPHTEPVPYT